MTNSSIVDATKEYLVFIFLAVVGSAKAITQNSKRKTLDRMVDFVLGIVCGVISGLYMRNTADLWLSSIIVVLIAIVSVTIIDVVIRALPTIVPDVIGKFIKRWLG